MKHSLVIFLLLFSFESFAQLFGGSSGSSDSGASSGFKFRLLTNLKLERASMMTKNDDIEKRSLNGVGADAIVGFTYGAFLFGAGADYTLFFQATDKDKVSGTDTSGNLLTMQGVVGYAFGKLCLVGRYFFSADYTLSQKTQSGDSSVYSKPEGSYGISLLYRPGGKTTWSLSYTNINFTQAKTGDTQLTFSDSDEKINLNSLGISYGFMF